MLDTPELRRSTSLLSEYLYGLDNEFLLELSTHGMMLAYRTKTPNAMLSMKALKGTEVVHLQVPSNRKISLIEKQL